MERHTMKPLSFTCLILFLIFLFSLSSCDILGSNSSGGSDAGEETDAGDGSGGGGEQPVPLDGYDLALETGSYWTFYWSYEGASGWMSSYDSNSTTTEDSGFATVTLGEPEMVGGFSLFEAELTGDIPEKWEDGNFWTHLGISDGSLVGSDDGFSVKTIINGDYSRSENGFFRFFQADQDISAATFSADTPSEYSTTAHYSGYSTSTDESVSVPGYGYIAGDQTTYNLKEYYKPGLGPLGYYEYSYWREEGSTDYWGRHTWNFSLSSTSLEAEDGFEVPSPPWRIRGDMPGGVRREPEAEIVNGVLYVLGGEKADYSANTSFYREESDGSWTSLGTVPGGSWISSSATTRITSLWEELLLVVDTSNPTAYSYNTSSDSWSTLGNYSTTASLYDCFMWGTNWLYPIMGSFSVPYQFSTGTFLGYEDMIDFNDDMTYMSAKVEGDYIYIVGQYKVSGGGMFGGEYVYSTRLFYYDGSGWSVPSWSVDSKRRWCPALAVYGDRLYVIGGTEDGTDVVSCSIAGGAPTDWRTYSPMLYGGTNLDAVVRGDEIWVFGCDGGKKIEIYSPGDDS